jgi:Cft2 family RNA processing exonuclease
MMGLALLGAAALAGCTLMQVFARGGNALLPVDSSGRMLEVLLVLDQLWHQHK